jgi:hypothetical protein
VTAAGREWRKGARLDQEGAEGVRADPSEASSRRVATSSGLHAMEEQARRRCLAVEPRSDAAVLGIASATC